MWISEKKMGIPERTVSIKPTTLFVDAAKYNTHVAAFGARTCYTFMYQKGSSIKYTVETTECVQRYRGNIKRQFVCADALTTYNYRANYSDKCSLSSLYE